MRPGIVGRDEELLALRGFVAAAGGDAAALVLEGAPGIGKSTLLQGAVAEARKLGVRVLVARPAEAERGLPHAGLADLLEPVLGELVPTLPGPRRHALEVAFLLAEPDERADPRTLPVAVRSALLALAAEGPVLLAVDDVQWLDPSSAAALAFAVRRLEGEPVRVLLARRVEEGVEPPELERALDPERTERVRVGPLSVGAVQRLVQERLGRVLPRPLLLRVHEASGGNPFYALELARALPDEVDPTRPLPVPETLEGLVRARLAGLPEEARRALAVAAAQGQTPLGLLERAGVDRGALEAAERAQVIVRANGHVRFTHPLFASVLERQQPAAERRQIHARLARLVAEPVARARHRARSAAAYDAAVALELEQAARTAGTRGAAFAAAELAEQALRLTPADAEEDLHRRAVAAARAYVMAGDVARAEALARELLERTQRGPRRAEALLVLGDVEGDTAGGLHGETSQALLLEALDEAEGDPGLQVRIHARLSNFFALHGKEPQRGEEHARAAVELARSHGDAAVLSRALQALALVRCTAAQSDSPALADEACEHARRSGDEETLLRAKKLRCFLLLQTGRVDEGREAIDELDEEWGSRSEWISVYLANYHATNEVWAGEFGRGAEYAERARELAVSYGRAPPGSLGYLAFYAMHRGDFDEARAVGEAGAASTGLWRASSEAVLGRVELWSGDPQAAADHFAAAERARDTDAPREPRSYGWRPEYCEALLELGRADDAEALLDSWEPDVARLGRDRLLAQILRCRGLVAAARGELDEALRLLEQAAERQAELSARYDRGRTLLALGTLRRRARQRRAAREALEAALAAFEACGSELFAGKARAELGSIGGRTRVDGLSAAERRVALLVAAGKTNREAAAALFVSERTVASHLTHVYAKLGVRSRTELALVLGAVP
jgi:DNA-binding CsgD family transcriptional regulator